MSTTDEQLAARAAVGDRSAMEELAIRFHPPLYRYYLKLARHPEDAKDLAQTALMRMIEKVHKYRDGSGNKFSSWLFKLAYHLFIDETRRKKPAPIEAETLERVADDADAHALTDDRGQVEALLRALDTEMRSMVILRYYIELSYDEIARAMGTSPQRVKWRLHDALEKLRKEAGA